MCVREPVNLTESGDDDIVNYLKVILILFVVVFVVVAYINIISLNDFLNNQYHSETKAFDIGNMRCDFYIQYKGCEVINVTKTDFCITRINR